MTVKEWSVKWKAPGSKGMLSNADLLDIPPDYAKSVTNADISRELGVLRKTFGFDRHPIALLSTFPTDLDDVLSLGWMTYIQVWEGTEEVNKKMGRLYVQVNGDNAIDYYYLEYDFEDEVWVEWMGPFNENDIYGTTLAEIPIKWTPFNNVMRGALGNEGASYPLWMGYVNRNKNDDNGFFHRYTYLNETDMQESVGIREEQFLPASRCYFVSATLSVYPFNESNYEEERILVIAVPIYDGHQICSSYQIDEPSTALKYLLMDTEGSGIKAFRVSLRVDWRLIDGTEKCSRRITGLNIYESRSKYEAFSWSPWVLSKHIDIREGNQLPRDSHTGYIYQYPNDQSAYHNYYALRTDLVGWPNHLYNDMWVAIREYGQDTIKRYRIVITENYNNFYWIVFDTTTGFTNGTFAYGGIEERWHEGIADRAYHIFMQFRGDVLTTDSPPAWLPDPNRLLDNTYKHPVVTCNYKHSIEFEGRHFVGDIFYDGAKRPLLVRYSNPVLDPFAGHDLFPNFIDIPSHKGDKIMGFAKTLFMYPDMAKHVLSVLTEESIFRFTFSGGLPALHETVYGVGLVAPKSLAVDDKGNWWFFGKKGKLRSVFKYDGFHEPKDVGDKRLRSQIEEALAKDGVDEEQAIGWIDKHTNKYRISIRAFQLLL